MTHPLPYVLSQSDAREGPLYYDHFPSLGEGKLQSENVKFHKKLKPQKKSVIATQNDVSFKF